MHNWFKDKYKGFEAINNKNIATKDLKIGTIQLYPGWIYFVLLKVMNAPLEASKWRKTHRKCKALTMRIKGEIKIVSQFYGH